MEMKVEIEEYVIVALLATGEDATRDTLLELSAIRYQDGKRKETYTQLVRPESYYLIGYEELEKKEDYCIVDGGPVYYIDRKVTRQTGITNQMLYHAKSEQEVMEGFAAFVGKSKLVGFDLPWQLAFLNQALEQHGISMLSNECLDCKQIARRLRIGREELTLNELALLQGCSYTGQMRAEPLALVVHEVYRKLLPVVRAVDCVQTRGEGTEELSLVGQQIVFTGTLTRMVRGKAMCLARECGAITGTSVSKKTKYLVLGNKEFAARQRGEKSIKLRKAERLVEEGYPLRIISEEVFYQMVGY